MARFVPFRSEKDNTKVSRFEKFSSANIQRLNKIKDDLLNKYSAEKASDESKKAIQQIVKDKGLRSYGGSSSVYTDNLGLVYSTETGVVYGSMDEYDAHQELLSKEPELEQGRGFRKTILTGGSGLAGTIPSQLRRAGSLLSGLDTKDQFIIS